MPDDSVLAGKSFVFGPFCLIEAERVLTKDGRPVSIGGRAFDVLVALMNRAGEVVTRRELMDSVWRGFVVEEANLRAHIAALRKILGGPEESDRYIVNVPGRGYSFVAPLRLSLESPDATIWSANQSHPASALPTPPQFLVGRATDVEAVSTLLLSTRFVTVTGPGGIGKTTLALAVANDLKKQFSDETVRFIDFGLLSHEADVASTVASVLGCVVQGSDPQPYILAFLQNRRFLVVLDNCEHLINSVTELTEALFQKTPTLYLLTTSREALRADGESVYRLGPLEGPSDNITTAEQALALPAIQLFMEKAASSGHRSVLSDLDAPIVSEICRHLDGIALSIELVASHVGNNGIEGTAQLLDRGAELLLQGRRSALPRHQSLHSMLDWSFNLLSNDEKLAFVRLSVFAGPFTLDAAIAVARQQSDDGLALAHAISGLIQKSLISVSRDFGPAMYRLLETTRSYAAAKLIATGELPATVRRHALYFSEFLKSVDHEQSFFHRRDALAYEPHLSNIRKALTWTFSEGGDRSIGVDLAIRSAPIFLCLSSFTECELWCKRALEEIHSNADSDRRELALQMSIAISSMYKYGNRDEVKKAIDRGLELSQTPHGARRRFDFLSGLHAYLVRRGDSNGAFEVAEQSFAVAKSNHNSTEMAVAHWMLGGALHLLGDQSGAIQHCKMGFQFISDIERREAGYFGYDHRLIGTVTLARASWISGLPDQGRKAAQDAIRGARDCDHPITYCIALSYAAYVLIWCGDYSTAFEIAESIVEKAERYALVPYRAAGTAMKGELMVHSGDVASGVALIRQALKTMVGENYHITRSMVCVGLGQGLKRLGRAKEGLEIVDEAMQQADNRGDGLWISELLRIRAELAMSLPQPDLLAAEQDLMRSIAHARNQSAMSWELRSAVSMAGLQSMQGRRAEAQQRLKLVFERFQEGFDTSDLVAARQLLNEPDAIQS